MALILATRNERSPVDDDDDDDVWATAYPQGFFVFKYVSTTFRGPCLHDDRWE